MADTVHLFVFDGFADWEAAFAVAGINTPEFQREPGRWRVRTVAVAAQPVLSMGGLRVLPDMALAQLQPRDSALLVLPGGAGWELPAGAEAEGEAEADTEAQRAEPHGLALDAAAAFLAADVPLAAICGATARLARRGLLAGRRHTSNAASDLKGTRYGDAAGYVEQPAVQDGCLITAGGMAALEFARTIFAALEIDEPEALEAWYQLNKTGKSEYFARLARAA